MSPMQTILDFIDAWNDNDIDRIHDFMAEDIFYHNVPTEPIVGRTAAREFAEAFGIGSKMKADWQLICIAENGEHVLTERIDSFITSDGKKISVPLMGSFRVRDGLITEWRDYFDLPTFERQVAAI
jgi:limonene-1,2-epoxide hydrolase